MLKATCKSKNFSKIKRILTHLQHVFAFEYLIRTKIEEIGLILGKILKKLT